MYHVITQAVKALLSARQMYIIIINVVNLDAE